MVERCNICGVVGRWLPAEVATALGVVRLVRDHNHLTGMIRGYLCDRCNSYLSVLERTPHFYYFRYGKKKFRAWVFDHAEKIWSHLQNNTGEVYFSRYIYSGGGTMNSLLKSFGLAEAEGKDKEI